MKGPSSWSVIFRFSLSAVIVAGAIRLFFALLTDRETLGDSPVARGVLLGVLASAVIVPAVIWFCYIPTFRRKRQVMVQRATALVIAAAIPGANLDKEFEMLGAKRNSRGKFGFPFTVTIDTDMVSFWRGSGNSLEEFLAISARDVIEVRAMEGADWTGRWSRFCVLSVRSAGEVREVWFAPYSEARAAVYPESRKRLTEIVAQARSFLVSGT